MATRTSRARMCLVTPARRLLPSSPCKVERRESLHVRCPNGHENSDRELCCHECNALMPPIVELSRGSHIRWRAGPEHLAKTPTDFEVESDLTGSIGAAEHRPRPPRSKPSDAIKR